MPLDPYLSAKLHLLEGVDMATLDAITRARQVEFEQDPAPWSMDPGVVTHDTWVPGPHGEIACRVYRPD
jgi:hypothetical protein